MGSTYRYTVRIEDVSTVNECIEMMDRQILITNGRALTLGISNKRWKMGEEGNIYCVGDEVTLRSE